MASDLEDSGGHEVAPRPWVVQDRVDHAAILRSYAHALRAAANSVDGAADRCEGLRPGVELDAVLTLLRGFLRRTISSQIVAFSVLGDDLPGPVKEDP